MRALLARYQAEPGHGDAVEARACEQMADAVARDEPGCLTIGPPGRSRSPDVFVLYEEYVDEAALLAHRETPHFSALIEGTHRARCSSRGSARSWCPSWHADPGAAT